MPPGPLELFRLLREDPAFAWLQPATRLIVDLDELASSDFERAAALSLVDRLATMLDGSDPDFGTRYRALLQRDLDFGATHAGLRGAIKSVRSALAP
jgi:hypothetical protein